MTTTTVRPAKLFTAPHPDPLPGTLLSAATIIESTNLIEPDDLYETYNCLTMGAFATFPCPPSLLAVPTMAAPATATSGGTLAAGTYKAKVTAINPRGETGVSAEASQVTTGTTSTVTFNWSNVTGETGYRLYITNGAAGSEAFYIELAANTTSYVMTAYPVVGRVDATPPSGNTAVLPVTKTFEAPNWQDGIRFAVYGGLQCKGIGLDPGTQAEIESAFLRKEHVGIERAIMQQRFIAGSGWVLAPDLTPTPGTAVDPAVALALLEGDAASKYAGVPTIHTPRSIGTILTKYGMVDRVGNAFFSKQGSKIASGGGYDSPSNGPDGTAPAAGTVWMYASGEVQVMRGPLITQPQLDRSTNDMTILMERLYVATVDCYTAAVLTKVV